jgi:hypothetical protein
MKYLFLVLVVLLFINCNKKNGKIFFEENQTIIVHEMEMKAEIEKLVLNDDNFNINNIFSMEFYQKPNRIPRYVDDTDDISFVTPLDVRIFFLDNLTKDIHRIPELYKDNYFISESKRSGNREPTGILPDNETVLIEVYNIDFEIYFWKKDNNVQIRRIILNNDTEISPLSKYIGASIDEVINDFGKPIFQDGANNGDYGTLYYGISDGRTTYFGECEVYFSHKYLIVDRISYGLRNLLIKGWD